MNKSYLLILILALSACGKNAAQTNAQNIPECKTTQEQVDTTMELIHNHKIALLKLLRSEENKDNKIAGIERLYSEIKSFNAANGSICRDPDGTGRSATEGDTIGELLLAGIGDVKAEKPVDGGADRDRYRWWHGDNRHWCFFASTRWLCLFQSAASRTIALARRHGRCA